MNFKKIIIIGLLGIFALLAIRSVQAADVTAKVASEAVKKAAEEITQNPSMVEAIKNTLSDYAMSSVDYLESKSYITINPITLGKKTFFFGKNHPWWTLTIVLGSLYGYGKYSAWYNKNAISLTELGKIIHQDYMSQKSTHQANAIATANKYLTPYGFKNQTLITAVNNFYTQLPLRSMENYTTIIGICGNNF